MSDNALPRSAVVGAGRMGTAVTTTLPELAGPFRRGFDGTDPPGATYEMVLLCVPDREIATAAAALRPGPLVGHCSGSIGPEVLAPHEGFVLHPLMTVRGAGAGELAGAGCTVQATIPRADAVARSLATALDMTPATLAPEDRAAYHAAASFAANFLVTVEACAERLLASTDVPRALLVPLVRAAVANWADVGPERALTGPVARGDDETVAVQRDAIAQREPDLLPLFDALVVQTRVVAGRAKEAIG